MNVAIPRETNLREKRVAFLPNNVENLVGAGASVSIEADLGQTLHIPDSEYISAGASVSESREQLLSNADLTLRLRKPDQGDITALTGGSILISYLDPFTEPELLQSLATRNI